MAASEQEWSPTPCGRWRIRLVALVQAALFTAILSVNPNGSRGADVSTATDTAAVVRELAQIKSAFLEGNKLFQNMRVRGQMDKERLPFVLTIYNGKARFDEEVFDGNGGQVPSYRLNDGTNYFLLNDVQLGILPLKDFINQWRVSCSSFYRFQLPWVAGPKTVDEYCDFLTSSIEGTGYFEGKPQFRTSDLTLTITRADNLVTIAYGDEGKIKVDGGQLMAITLDSSKNYQMVRSLEVQGSYPGNPTWAYRREVVSTLKEIAPEIYFLGSGTCVIEESGDIAVRNNRAPKSETSVEITGVEFGDFQLEPDIFDIHKLPVWKGMPVHDERLEPPANYLYGGGPLDEAAMSRAIQTGPKRVTTDSGKTTRLFWIMASNIAAVLVAALLIIQQRRGATK